MSGQKENKSKSKAKTDKERNKASVIVKKWSWWKRERKKCD